MQVSDPNNVKIYNLSSGKSVPEWLSDRKKRSLAKSDIDIRRRIELLQDFTMPDISNTVKVSKDGHYILSTGIYKPRVRCYEVDNLSMKFERCMDAEIVTFEILSDDYSKLVFMQNDRHIELHSAGGRYFKLRIPKFGRDMKYQETTCDLLLSAAGSDIYRLNLERGQFLNSFTTEASEVNKLNINPAHQLITAGTKEGWVEAWDPRQKKRVGTLDCLASTLSEHTQVEGFPSITSLESLGPLTLGVGTATGQILLYDIRSDKPLIVKDHMYGFAIRDLAFQDNYVLSLDSAIVKIWDKDTGKIFTTIEAGNDTMFNSLCHVPNSGLIFMANEAPKIRAYYIPQLGTAPKWCYFLDNLTEELEETKTEIVYDDYKFVTKKELEELQLSHLIGSKLLRGYMHGYFMSMKLYNRAKAMAQPFSYEEYKRKKIREKLEKDRTSRVQVKNLPKVNKDFALKLMDDARDPKKKKKAESSELLTDSRFSAMFENPDFQIDITSEEYRMLNPVLSRLTASRKKELLKQQFTPVEEEAMEEKAGSDGSDIWSSDDEDKSWAKEVKAEHRKIAREKELQERREKPKTKMYAIKDGASYSSSVRDVSEPVNKAALGERVREEKKEEVKVLSSGNREMTFVPEKKRKGMDTDTMKRHRQERKQTFRPAPNTFRMPKSQMFKRKRR
ncbi:Nucleolar protein [Nesidiocoris tenuis]|uniref:Nucleolar protein n=1 Tax=Nesidiocoris tenuis TaxID=355587 RepID=A0ABN7ARE2_9HEMI|nr:Nucleolar protein [Nesidiocoris tenuis]